MSQKRATRRAGDVLEAYEHPLHDWRGEPICRLFNATTFALAGRIAENPSIISGLHNVIDAMAN